MMNKMIGFLTLTVTLYTTVAKEVVDLQVDEKPLAAGVKQATSYAPMLKRVMPSIVSVYSTKHMNMQGHPNIDPAWQWFFGNPHGNPHGSPHGSPRGQTPYKLPPSLGSGVIVSADGYILTNNHVVEDADEIKVKLAGSKIEYTAKVVGTDPNTDIGILKIDGRNLPAITLTDSDKLEVGDSVLAIGNPFGVGQTVTRGMVSAIARGGLGITDYEDFIQTDASINPGNSGGALVDAEGRLVGINTAIFSRTGGNNGIGFAVPTNIARSVMDSILEHGRVARGYLGVAIQDITPELAESMELKKLDGVIVSDVTSGSASEAAGMEPGDILVEFNGKPVKDVRSLRLMVSMTPPGKEVSVKVLRKGTLKSLLAKLDELPATATAGVPIRSWQEPKEVGLRGATLGQLTPELRRKLEIPVRLEGVPVTSIAPGSAAAESELAVNDVILEINRNAVTEPDQVAPILKTVKDGSLLLYIWSEGRRRFVTIKGEE